mgnify:CR=1 FL=1
MQARGVSWRGTWGATLGRRSLEWGVIDIWNRSGSSSASAGTKVLVCSELLFLLSSTYHLGPREISKGELSWSSSGRRGRYQHTRVSRNIQCFVQCAVGHGGRRDGEQRPFESAVLLCRMVASTCSSSTGEQLNYALCLARQRLLVTPPSSTMHASRKSMSLAYPAISA